jgi:hypothetical protein
MNTLYILGMNTAAAGGCRYDLRQNRYATAAHWKVELTETCLEQRPYRNNDSGNKNCFVSGAVRHSWPCTAVT